jgi:hypothetical protein
MSNSLTFSPALMPSRRHASKVDTTRPQGPRNSPVQLETVSCLEWVLRAAEHARFEGEKPERYAYRRASRGGWEWTNVIKSHDD